MGEFEGIGDAVTGGLLARAVEPKTGVIGDDGHTHERNCLNCGTPLAGDYCHVCGQRAHVHRSLRGFFQDLVQGLFNFEGKIWQTLPMLAWRPGELTRRYIAGERARFVSPVALYLFSVFLMFAVINFNDDIDSKSASVRSGIETALREQRGEIVKLEAERTAAVSKREDITALEQKIADNKKDLAQLEGLQKGAIIQADFGENDEAPGWLKELVKQGQSNPERLATGIQDAASKYSWMLIPISVPFLWLLFPFSRRYRMYDHTVFVTYSLSFMMILVIVGGIFAAVGASGVAAMLFLVPPLHMYRQLKEAYDLSRRSALLRTAALVTFAFIAGALFFAMAAAIGAA
jgi:Protein of unknown function (DUF3667)